MASNPDRLLTVIQLAERWHCHPMTVRRAIQRGDLPAVKDGLRSGSPYLVSEGDAETYRQSRIRPA